MSPCNRPGDDEITDIEEAVAVFQENGRILLERDAALAARTQELEEANAELDNFAYVASHDLRAPLRAIENLASFIAEDLGEDMPEDSARHLALLRSRIKRLDGLLTGLLEYSRVGRTDAALKETDLTVLIEQSADLVVPDGFHMELTGEFPVVNTAATPLQQIVRNLIDNAVKHHDSDTGRIAIDGRVHANTFVFKVSDDGPGIEPRYHERVFKLFQTLKARDKVEGSGMGLAILKKVVESHGGRIRIESDPAVERGTTFTVEWPVSATNSPGFEQSDIKTGAGLLTSNP